MGLPVTVYRWDDVGAPQITSTTPKVWIDILKACLVNGYGNKTPAGWTIPFEDLNSNKVAFRNSTTDGSGGCIQFWSGDGGNLETSPLLYKPAKSMPNLDVFVNGGFTEVWKGASSQQKNTQWMIIATSVSFYIFTLVNNETLISKSSYSMFVGDIDSFVPNDASRFVGGAAGTADRLTDTSISQSTQSLMYDTALNFKPKLYETDGSSNFVMSQGCTYLAQSTPFKSTVSDTDSQAPLILYDVMLFGASGYVSDSNSVDPIVSQLQPFVRGRMVGLKLSLFRGNMGQQFPYIRNINGVNHMLLPPMAGVVPLYWLNIEEWY